jgi:ketosteroid isomerase-like protein
MLASALYEQPSSQVADIVRRVYAAWPAGDRDALEALLADEFRFTSPYDDALDRATFFARCWPHHVEMLDVTIKKLVVADDSAYVTYVLRTKNDRVIENTELLRLSGGKVASVDVYFGATRDPSGRFVPLTT